MKVFSEDKETKANLTEFSFLENCSGVLVFPKKNKSTINQNKILVYGTLQASKFNKNRLCPW